MLTTFTSTATKNVHRW